MAFQTKYIYDLVDRMTPAIKKIQTSVESSSLKIKQNADKINSSFTQIEHKLDSIGKKAGSMGKSLFIKATVPIALMSGSFIKAASDYEESINKVDVAFGNAAAGVKEFAKSAGQNFGIDRGSALDMAAMFGDMSTAMGLSQENASTLSQKLVGLAGDLASFKNIGVDQATTALAGVFTGETESLKRLGVVMTEQNLQQFAQEQGIRKNLKAFTQAEKVLLRYRFVTQMTKNAQGDFIRTNEGFANQFRIMKSRFKDLSITLGSILLPYAVKLINVVIKLIEKFQNLSPRVQKFILIIAGVTAVLGPILIAISLMIPALALLGKGVMIAVGAFKILTTIMIANPIGAFIAATILVITYWDNIVSIFKSAFEWVSKFVDKLNIVKGLTDLFKGGNVQINNQAEINSAANQMIGGRLDVNFANMPKGTNTNFTPIRNNSLNVGMMTEWAQ